MARLRHVAFDGLLDTRAVLGGVGVGEARPGGVIASFDGLKPGKTIRETTRGMEVRQY